MKDAVLHPERDKFLREIRNAFIPLRKPPGYPADIIVARVRVIVAALSIAEFIAGINERYSL